ncbi:hypothetical protein CPB84DRAFT_1777777 [Gymnopilus junonius]|uniref:Uncharacterized protein n=1 Tax=Gymnopilus junonius TaxID=109634 RepID=A0A9P5NQL5_GYMJU|nr:hypothetical protein CPB84DRAFT_1777777 [Gymnopilus junonius]
MRDFRIAVTRLFPTPSFRTYLRTFMTSELSTSYFGSRHVQAVDLRHKTSNSSLASPTREHRSAAQHPRTMDPQLGSRPPSSIPSSPTSIQSSSSAIFERDIEPVVPPSPPILLNHHTHHHTPNPHRIPRAKGSEALEQSVPSVLDSAAAILSTLKIDVGDVADQVAVVAPATSSFSLDSMGGRSSGFASPIGSFRSRSPSPIGSRTGDGRGAEQLVLDISASSGLPPQLISSAVSSAPVSLLGLHVTSAVASPSSDSGSSTSASSPSSKSQVIPATTISQVHQPSVASMTTPTIIASSIAQKRVLPITAGSEESTEPPMATQAYPPAPPTTRPSPSSIPSSLPLQPLSLPSPHSISSTTSPISSPSSAHPTLSSHPPSPIQSAKKRLSFMSYSDLLSSTPSGLQPLSSLTTCANAVEPPPHIPSVSGLNLVNTIHAQQQQSSQSGPGSATPSLRGFPISLGGPTSGVTHAGMRDSISMLDNVGGEWERQGLGKGLEERLDALVIPPAGGLPLSPVWPAVHPHSVVGISSLMVKVLDVLS